MAHVEPLREDDPRTVGVYRLLGRLGSGGQGTVFLGETPDGRRVAVKVLHDSAGFDDRLAKEIAAAGQVAPFCIAQVLDASPGRPAYIVTEYVEGPSLQQAGRHAGADLQRLAVATATALAAIHEAGVVHRDFKPANVLLGPGGPRVIDFGIARAAGAAATVSTGIVGTPAYMAPEQLAGQPVGPPADVFAWASVIVWAATGGPPFGQDTLPAVINRVLHNEPQLGDLAHPLRSLVYDCLAKDPRARPAMRDVLLRLLGGRQPQPPGSPPTPPNGEYPTRAGGRPAAMGGGQRGGDGPMGAGVQHVPEGWDIRHPPMGGDSYDRQPPRSGPPNGPYPPHGPNGPYPPYGPMGGAEGPYPPYGARGVGRSSSRGRKGIVVAVAAGVAVAAVIGGVAWVVPWPGPSGQETLAAPSTSPSTPTASPTTSSPPSTGPTRARKSPTAAPRRTTTDKPATRPTRTAEPSPSPSPQRTKAASPSATPKPTRKPVTARVSILQIKLSGGPGQADADGCLMPPVHFQTYVESSRQGVWISYAWRVDGRSVESGRSWVPRDDYTAFVTAKQYMLDAGGHTVSLRITSPSSANKSVSVDVCSVDH
ncbi:protein kinase [Nonomuraea sp. NPDC049714]|uniref:serine/threonine-protein kinase n=1 Tax=Nonomuraea sp. NPDC049714 TaxID=3364357 RepID=UPI00379180C8